MMNIFDDQIKIGQHSLDFYVYVCMYVVHFYDTPISLKNMAKCAFVNIETQSNFRFP